MFVCSGLIQRANGNLPEITDSKASISAMGNVADSPGSISQHVGYNTIHLNRVRSQNDPFHDHGGMAGLTGKIALDTIDNVQIRRQNSIQLGNSPAQVYTVEPGFHRSGHDTFEIF